MQNKNCLESWENKTVLNYYVSHRNNEEDIYPSEKILFDYLETHPQKSIISGVYVADPNNKTLAPTIKHQRLTIKQFKNKSKPFKVDSGAFGFMLIRNGVFESLEYPWFEHFTSQNTKGDVRKVIGEDISFSHKAKDKGFQSYVHPQVTVGHLKPYVVK